MIESEGWHNIHPIWRLNHSHPFNPICHFYIMTNAGALPTWANLLTEVVQQRVAELNEETVAYNRELDEQKKAELLESALVMLSLVENLAGRFKFFLKTEGLNKVGSLLEIEVSKWTARGVKIKAVPTLNLTNILFVDTETTGLSGDNQPISIGAVLAEVDSATGIVVAEIGSYYGLREPSCEISLGAYRVHGISKAQLKEKEFDLRELVAMFGVAEIIVAHNAAFDRRMLQFVDDEHRRWGCSCRDIDWPKEIGGRSLDAICNYFGIRRPATHNALSDTRVMIDALQQRQRDGSTYLKCLLLKHGISAYVKTE